MNFPTLSFLKHWRVITKSWKAPAVWEYKCNIVLAEFFPLHFFFYKFFFLKHLCPCYCSCLMRRAHEIGVQKWPAWRLYHGLLIYTFISLSSPKLGFGKNMQFWWYPVRWQGWFTSWLLLKFTCSDPSLSLLISLRWQKTFHFLLSFFFIIIFSSSFGEMNLFSEGKVERWELRKGRKCVCLFWEQWTLQILLTLIS